MTAGRFDRLLRWYPDEWRRRYGRELSVLLEDTYGDGAVPRGERWALVRAGIVERAREAELIGGSVHGAEDRIRAGGLLVLWAWAAFIVAGAGFAKFTEHWETVTPRGSRWLPSAAFGLVQGGAFVAAAAVALAAALAVPPLLRSLREGGWPTMRRPFVRAAVVVSVTVADGVAMIIWAHRLDAAQRNGGLHAYGIAALIGVGLVVASIALCTSAAVSVTRRLDLGATALRVQGFLTFITSIAMLVVTAGVVTWWAAVAASAPWFFGRGVPGSTASPLAPAMIVSGVLMTIGLALAARGASVAGRGLLLARGRRLASAGECGPDD